MLSGCITDNLPTIPAASAFELARYSGQWYEIARLDNSFERGLNCVHAEYSAAEDGRINVINRGYDTLRQKWKESFGKAYFVNRPDEGLLKVSFFGPFYGLYKIASLDHENYRWSLVMGPNHDYLWFLSRSKTITPELKKALLTKASQLGFNTDALVWVDQSCPDS